MTAMSQVEVLRAACCVAGGDGEVDSQERSFLTGLAERVGVGRASLEAMIQRSEEEPDFYKQQFRVLKDDPEATIELLFGVAATDGELEKSEVEMLKLFGRRLEISSERFVEIGRGVQKELRGRRDAQS